MGFLKIGKSVVSTLNLAETTTPQAAPGVGKVYTKADNLLYFQDGGGDENVLGESSYGEFKVVDNANPTTINAAGEWHALQNDVIVGALKGFTYTAGTTNTITSVANAGGGDILVTTGSAHSISVGDIITQNGNADAAYNGIFEVLTTPAADTYTVTAVYTATDTGFVQRGSTLTVSGGNGGAAYKGTWASSGISATINHVFDFAPVVNTTVAAAAKARRKFSNTDFGSFSGTELPTLAAGDKITFVIQNVGASGDMTIRTLDLNLHRL